MHQPQVISVSDLTKMIKAQLEQPQFSHIVVEGEISNFKHHTSGHMYFTLKDATSRIKVVMFRSRNIRLNFKPKNGETVVLVGSLGVYEPNGEYQIYAEQILPQGVGLLHVKFEALKQKLEAEGLFAAERKLALPFMPSKIGIITSPTSAAVHDCLSVIQRRFPTMDILIIPAVVQGNDGPASIIAAFEQVNSQQDLDLIILTRGGGSIEELWSFNDEGVARAIAACPIPVISGVGHETDFTIADFVADFRAATPSAAAELAVPDFQHLTRQVDQNLERLKSGIGKFIRDKQLALNYITERRVFLKPEERITQEMQYLDEIVAKLSIINANQIQNAKQNLSSLVGKLDSLSPLSVLGRGYAVCQKLDTTVVRQVKQVEVGEQVVVRLESGQLLCEVQKGEVTNYER